MRNDLLSLDARRTLERLERKFGPLTDPHGDRARVLLSRLATKWGAL